MDKATRKMMNEAEQEMLRLVESKELDRLDEDQLVDLHKRVRRARNKYSKLHRRRAADRVGTHGNRATATKAGRRTAAKAEVFEGALATVSRRLAKAAAASALALRDERLAAARGKGGRAGRGKGKGKGKGPSPSSTRTGSTKGRKKARTPDRERRTATARASGRRQQAKRDGR